MDVQWPGDPMMQWERAAPTDQWLPTRADFPAFSTPEQLAAKYALAPVWWNRAILAIIGVVGIMICVGGFAGGWLDGNVLRRVFLVVLSVVILVTSVPLIVGWIRSELLWRRARVEVANRAFDAVVREDTPIWGIFANKARLGDRASGDQTPDDLLLMLDLRVDRAVLARQVAVVSAWLDAVAASETGIADLAAAFSKRDSVHGLEIFGEQMRGVWIGRKPSILPHQVLGLAIEDPRDAASFTDDDVLFTRSTDRELRRRSRIVRA